MVNVGRYRIHGCYGLVHPKDPGIKLACVFSFVSLHGKKSQKKINLWGSFNGAFLFIFLIFRVIFHMMQMYWGLPKPCHSGQIIYSFFVKGTLKKASQSTGFPVFRQGKSKFIFLHDGFSIFELCTKMGWMSYFLRRSSVIEIPTVNF